MNDMYIALDGDFVGRKIETLILDERLEELFEYNKMVSETILTIEFLIKKHGGQVFLSGGDNILAYDPEYSETIDFMIELNQKNSDLKFSVGYAPNVKLAYLSLKYAKRSDKGKVIKMHVEDNEIKIESR